MPWGSWAGHEPTAAAYRTHKYNWSITTACTLSITLSKLGSIHPTDRCLNGSLTKAARSLSLGVMLKNADTGHYTASGGGDGVGSDQMELP